MQPGVGHEFSRVYVCVCVCNCLWLIWQIYYLTHQLNIFYAHLWLCVQGPLVLVVIHNAERLFFDGSVLSCYWLLTPHTSSAACGAASVYPPNTPAAELHSEGRHLVFLLFFILSWLKRKDSYSRYHSRKLTAHNERVCKTPDFRVWIKGRNI